MASRCGGAPSNPGPCFLPSASTARSASNVCGTEHARLRREPVSVPRVVAKNAAHVRLAVKGQDTQQLTQGGDKRLAQVVERALESSIPQLVRKGAVDHRHGLEPAAIEQLVHQRKKEKDQVVA